MAEIVRMPKLSDTMTEGVVTKWHKNIGDQVKEGDLLAEIETDKATMEFESYVSGVLLHRGVKEGVAAEVDTILAILGEKGENFESLLSEEQTAVEPNIPVTTEEQFSEAVTQNSDSLTTAVAPDVKAQIIAMPKLSDTMTEGVVAKWHKKVGDKVKNGDLLAEIETDKATMEFESYEEGELLYVGVS
ncbi:MAG TPA: pyruvate dehydrogenase, partial [Flavobacteriales bacterium]|nr:pyruvate dehydrogenase [Flavobacteriales bacterium]